MAQLLQDIRYGLRLIARAPGFALVAVTVLTLGIGVNATVFSLTNAFFLRPLPVSDPDRLVRVYSNRYSNTSLRSYVEYRDSNATLEGLSAFQMQSFSLRAGGEAEHAFGEIVSGNYFDVLGIPAARGRLLTADDDRPGAPPVMVLAHAFWQRRFGAAEDIVGRTVALNGQTFTVVGVAPRGFTGVLTPLVGDLWVPLAADAVLRPALEDTARRSITMHLMGRLKAGVDRPQAQADLDTIGQRLRAAAGESGERRPAVSVYPATMLHPEAWQPATVFTAVLTVVVLLALLIVCVNLANLVLARATTRQVEFAIRQSIGAGRGRLVRQLLTENLLLALAGGAGGLLLAFWGTRWLMAARLPAPVPIELDLSLDVRVLAFTTLVAVAATVAFGMVPAVSASRLDLVRGLKAIAGDGRGHSRLRSTFLIAQVSLSVVLLVAAGLFIRSYRHVQSTYPGFESKGVLTATLNLQTRGYSDSRGREFARALVERLKSAPGIESATLVDIVPLTLSNTAGFMLRDGDAPPTRDQPPPTPIVNTNSVSPGHFETLRIPLVEGRDFSDRDTEAAPQVAIVNETLARLFWPGKSAVGQRLRPAGDTSGASRSLEIVGVARDSKYVTVGEEPRPFLYRPFAQTYQPQMTVLARVAGEPLSAVPTVTAQVQALDAGLPIFNVGTLETATSISLLPARIAGNLLGALGLLALALAALGIYGVLSFLVRARTREIGVRVAIGAAPREVVAMVVRDALRWTSVGAAIGFALALLITHLLRSLLYGISPTDPLTFGVVLILLAAVACAAAVMPALRAGRLDPVTALRDV